MARRRNTGRRRGRPIGSRNTRVNQYIRIRSLIWRERKDQYQSYFDPELLDIARRVNDECKTAGTDCDDELILSFHDSYSEGGRQYPVPVINPSLFKPQPYWEIKNVSDFAIEAANIYFYSPMLIAPPSGFRSIDYANYVDHDGRRRLSLDRGYRKYFKEWVDWVNEYYRDQDIDDSDLIEVYFKLLKPTWDEEKGFWVVEIVSCTSDGRVTSFGFVPSGAGDFTTEGIPPTPPVEEPQPSETIPEQQPTVNPPTREQVEIEQLQKDKELERLEKMKIDAREDVKLWKEMDDQEEYEAAKKRLKEITKDIDKLRNAN
jgi:hypothetical protein